MLRNLDIQPFYQNIFNVTIKDPKIKKQLEFVSTFFEEWCGNFLHPLANEFFNQGKKVSILYGYLASQSLTFDWLAHTLILANYQTVLRELRAILENSFVFYAIDTRCADESADEKLKKLEVVTRGEATNDKNVFENSGYPYCPFLGQKPQPTQKDI